MKSKILCSAFCFLFFSFTIWSQQSIPSDADAFYRKAMGSINTAHIKWIRQMAAAMNTQGMDEAAIRKVAVVYGGQYNLNEMDIEALIALVMIQAAKDAEQDMKDIMEEMKKKNEEKEALRQAQETMERNKRSMSRQMLDSFKTLTNPKLTTVTKPQAQKIQPARNVPDKTTTNPTVNSKVSATEIKSVQEKMRAKIESLNEITQIKSMRLQQMMERRTKSIETLSNIMKKISETEDSIVKNLK